MASDRENFVNSDGVRLWSVQSGQGFPVMLCNGGPGCCDYLQPVAAMLDDMAHVIRFEERGCGRSESAPAYDIETCFADLENIRNYYNLDRWIIGGHSWGADLALLYALEYPSRVAGLLCIAGGRIHNDRSWHHEYKRRKAEEGERLPEFTYPPNRDVNEQLNRACKTYIQKPDLLLKISKLQAPALFVYGERDIRPSWPVKQVAQLMPNARFEMIDGAEHVIWFSHENELRLLLREFVKQVTFDSK
ncbi:MAG TPA: alpha/beta hydrolase [Pyrinomonadaceae bacterium]|nr:alpha/beta hydrolase [Pyrinomonadaceae bacterium]